MKRLTARSKQYVPLIAVTILAGATGLIMMRSSGAATYAANSEAENGVIAGNAGPGDTTGASAGAGIKFGVNTTPTPPPPSGRPNATNTGVPAGTVLQNYGANQGWNGTASLVIDGYDMPAPTQGYYHFAGNNVTLRNCRIHGGLLVSGDNVRVERCEIIGGISLSGTATAVVQYNNIHSFGDDGIHITSDTGQVSNATFAHNYVHTPIPEPGAHADGMQVRGVRGLTLTNNAIDMGVWRQVNGQDVLNAAVFLQADSNGGNFDCTLDGNYLNGGGYIFYLGSCPNTKLTNNRFGPDGHYGVVNSTAVAGSVTVQSGNVMDTTGQPVTF